MRSMIARLAFLPLLAFATSKPEYDPLKTSKDDNQFATCYSWNSGASIDIEEYIPDLSVFGIDNNDLSSCCVNGIWIFFDGINYNQDNPQVVEHFFVGCETIMNSFRYAGILTSYMGREQM